MNKETNQYCWNKIGVRGDRSCPELAVHIHCRNCSRYETTGRTLLDREAPENYLEDLTRLIAEPEKKKAAQSQTCLVFRLASEWLALPSGFFIEFTRPRPIRRVPHRNNQIFLGLASIRGDFTLCFSMAALLGIQALKENKPADDLMSRFCVISGHSQKWVFPADEIHGLGSYAENDVQPVPVTVAKTMQKYASGIIVVNKRQTGLLNGELIIAAFERSLS